MQSLLKRWGLGLAISLAALCGTLAPARAITRAGTHIDNTAYATFIFDGYPEARFDSPRVRFTVASLPAIALLPAYSRLVYPGQQVVLAHRVENRGNVPLSVRFSLSGAAWQPALALDRNSNGRLDTGEELLPSVVTLDVGEAASLLVTALVPADAVDGDTASFAVAAADPGNAVSAAVTDLLTVRKDAPAIIQLSADPSVILGNGRDRSKLTATVLTARGTPVPDGTPVTFTTPKGVFDNGLQTLTLPTQQGVASTYLTADIVSTVPVTAVAKIVAGTPITGIAEAEVEILFSPAAVAGLVSDHDGYRPVPGLPATLTGTDGTPMGSVTTQADGSFVIYIPREGTYILEVPVLNAVGDLVRVQQRIVVDRLGGAVFYPEGAVVGVVMNFNTRQPVGNTVLEFTLEAITEGARATRAMAPGDKVQITTDARGGFAISGLALGRYRFRVNSADANHYPYGSVDVDLTRPGQYVVNANILLDPFGYVYDSETGERVSGAMLTLVQAESGAVVSPQDGENPARAAADGIYRFLTGPGRYRLRVEAPGYRAYESAVLDVTRDVVNVNVPLDPLPVLALEKKASLDAAQPGGLVAYTLIATNTGLGTARGVSIIDVLPPHLTPVAESLGEGTRYDLEARRITWSIGDVPRLTGRVSLTFQARIDPVMPNGSTELVNTAFLAGPGIAEPGGTIAGGGISGPVASSPSVIVVTATPRLGISKAAEQAQVAAGDRVRFTIGFWNRGTAPAYNVAVTDTLPDGLAMPDGSRTVAWRIDRMDPGHEETRTLEVIAQGQGLPPGFTEVTNRVAISAHEAEPAEASAAVRVLVPYLRVTKRALVSEVETGDVVPFEIVVENLSAADEATAVDVRDLLPAVLHYRPGTSRLNGAATPEPQRTGDGCTWRIDRLAPRTAVRLSFHTVVAAGHGSEEEVVNTADATALAVTGQRMTASPSRASVRRRVGFFSDRGLILGRLFVDRNGNRRPDPGEPGVANVAVFSSSGVLAITDSEGKYVMPDVTPGEHILRVDLTTIPRGFSLRSIDNANAGTPHSRFCRLSRGGLAKANFAFIGEGPAVGTARAGTALLVPPEEARR